MIISHRRRFVFTHIRKTAGETIVATLQPALGSDDVFSWSGANRPRYRFGLHNPVERHLGLSKHSTAAEIRNALGLDTWDEYFTFTFVRNPVDRVVSLYNFLATVMNTHRRPNVASLRFLLSGSRFDDPRHWSATSAFLSTDSFSDFIRHPGALTDAGMLTQWSSLSDSDGALLVDFVGRFERFDEDLAEVQRRIGIDQRLPTNTVNRSTIRILETSEVGRSDLSYLRAHFAADFDRFGYR